MHAANKTKTVQSSENLLCFVFCHLVDPSSFHNVTKVLDIGGIVVYSCGSFYIIMHLDEEGLLIKNFCDNLPNSQLIQKASNVSCQLSPNLTLIAESPKKKVF